MFGERFWQWLFGAGADWALLWLGLGTFAIALLILTRTRWGQSRALEKCIILSLLAHVLLAGLATAVRIVVATGMPEPESIRISLSGDDLIAIETADSPPQPDRPSEVKPWDRFDAPPELLPRPSEVPRPDDAPAPPERVPDVVPHRPTAPPPVEVPLPPAAPDAAGPQLAMPPSAERQHVEAASIEAPLAERRDNPAAQAGPKLLPLDPPPDENDGPAQLAPSSVYAQPTAPPSQLATLPRETLEPEAVTAPDDLTGRTLRPSPAAEVDSSSGGAPEDHAAADGGGAAGTASPRSDSKVPPAVVRPGGGQLPDAYRNRFSPERARLAQQHGATPQSEAAVARALAWLAANQSADGRWEVVRLEGGRELRTYGHDRLNAGVGAETGVSALAILAFLGAGNTHLQGDYRETVRRGLEFLLRSQARDGNLAGEARLYARLYCHGMASFALGEAYALTGDERLRDAVARAVAYIVAMQHPDTGGWRYQAGDPGDMSQFGWQVMALRSAELAGLEIPETTRHRAVRFLQSTTHGQHSGLASYRPGERPTRVMTAEALVCRQFLDAARSPAALREAGDYLLGERPGDQTANLYYWYYGTLGMFQLQGEHWRTWNEAMRTTLVRSQRTDGSLAGSWDPDPIWGGYGGRAFSTALSAMCLEVYYRYLPLYAD